MLTSAINFAQQGGRLLVLMVGIWLAASFGSNGGWISMEKMENNRGDNWYGGSRGGFYFAFFFYLVELMDDKGRICVWSVDGQESFAWYRERLDTI